jgi:hypothetical protein
MQCVKLHAMINSHAATIDSAQLQAWRRDDAHASKDITHGCLHHIDRHESSGVEHLQQCTPLATRACTC